MTVLEETKNKMKELREKRAADLAAIQQKQDEANARKAEAVDALRAATEELDEDAYEAAKVARDRAQIVIQMTGARYGQIQKQELISEAESDQVIDSLLGYENKLTEDFRSAIKEPLRILSHLRDEYLQEVRDTEATLTAWQHDIHKNYNTRGRSFYTDPVTGETTSRSSRPVPVHQTPYTGCNEAELLGTLLRKIPVNMSEE